MIKVYIAGPYTQGDTALNVKNAIDTANFLADYGFAPYVPHFTHFWHMLHPRPYEFWLQLDNQFLTCCDAVLRIPGDSTGADLELRLAKKNRIPVFYNIENLLRHFKMNKKTEKKSKLRPLYRPPKSKIPTKVLPGEDFKKAK